MKIIQVTPRYPPRTGGVETHVQQISERLVDRGHEVTVFTADAGASVESHTTRNGVEVRRFRGFAPSDAFHIAPQIALAVRRADADVVHAHNYHSLPMLFAALGVIDERLVVTPHYHGGSASRLRDRLLSLYRPLGRWAMRRADAVIAVSEWERRELQRDFGIDATVIPNGIDVERFADAEPEARERPYLLSVGRLEEYKGIQDVIRALGGLPDFDLIIAGTGPYREQLEAIARDIDVRGRIEFLGYVDTDCLPGLYAGASVYVTLSRFEAFGMTVGEALAAGTPSVVRTGSALDDWTRYTAVSAVDTDEPPVVAEAIRSMVGTNTSVRPPTWNEVVENLIDQYRARED